MKFVSGIGSLFAIILLSNAGSLLAVEVQLNPIKDNTLYESQSGSLSNGRGLGLYAGRTQAGLVRRAVLAFDVSQIPPGSVVNSASLRLNVTNSSSGAQTTTLHRITKDWGEGASTASGAGGAGVNAATDDATWIHRFFNASLWDSPGGDFVGTASASASVGGTGTVVTWTSSAQLVADVQAWVDDSSGNFGWLVRGNEASNQSAKRFGSRESATPPLLVVDYTAPEIELTHELYLPQFGKGDGFSSKIVLLSSDRVNTIQARVTMRDEAGQPLNLELNGTPVPGGVLDLSIPPSGTRTFETTATGTIQLGSVVVASDRPITGLIVFGGSFGLAGVLGGDDFSRGFFGPVEVLTLPLINTGIAIQNLENDTVTIDVELLDVDGDFQGDGQIVLPPFGKFADFVTAIFDDDGVDFSNFVGSIRSNTQRSVAAVMIQNRIVNGVSQYATLPIEELPPAEQ